MAFAVHLDDVDVVSEAVEQRHNVFFEPRETFAGAQRTQGEGVGDIDIDQG